MDIKVTFTYNPRHARINVTTNFKYEGDFFSHNLNILTFFRNLGIDNA